MKEIQHEFMKKNVDMVGNFLNILCTFKLSVTFQVKCYFYF